MAQVTCIECGRTVTLPPSRARGAKFCSWACRAARPRNNKPNARVPWSCQWCGKAEMRQPSEAHKKFCSIACRDHSVRLNGSPLRIPESRVDVRCHQCDAPYTVHRSVVGRSKFCSRTCAGLGRPLPGRTSKVSMQILDLLRERHPHLVIDSEVRSGRWAIDIALTDLGVAIEIDGTYWHSLPGAAERDARKNEHLRSRGWRVERFPVYHEAPEVIVARIEQRLALAGIQPHQLCLY